MKQHHRPPCPLPTRHLTLSAMANSPLLTRLAQGPLLADGAMGTLLFERGIPYERSFDALNRSDAALIESIHRDYLQAGAELIETNTFGANRMRLAAHEALRPSAPPRPTGREAGPQRA